MLRFLLSLALFFCVSVAHAITVACSPHEIKNAITIESHSDGERKWFYAVFPANYEGEKFSSASISVRGKNKSFVRIPLAAEPAVPEEWAGKLVALVESVRSTASLSLEAKYGCTWLLTAEIPLR